MSSEKQGGPKKASGEKKHVLIVDDDELFGGALAQALNSEGYDATYVNHGKTAEDIIGVKEIHIVISDINMPGMSGIELMHRVKNLKPDLPVILMTGFAELKETKEAYELGARGFLPKPFKREELVKVLGEWLNPKSQATLDEENENQDLNYCKISINDFISGREIKYDIFVRLSEKKYLKIAHQGEDIPLERINSYKARNIKYLYMLKDDFRKYMGLNMTLLPLVTTKSNFSKEKKRAFLKHTSEVMMEHIFINGVDEEGFQSAKAIVESATSLLTEPDSIMSLLMILNSHSDHLYSHGLGVSTYAVMIARKVGWHSPANIYKIAIGGLLHDIGKKEIPREILDKQRKDLTAEEVQLYETHPQRGMEILGEIPTIPSDVLQIVLQHHENCLGLGFPMRLTKNHIHPMARLISVANDFCSLVLKGPHSLNLNPMGALQRMNSMQKDRYDRQFFEALTALFNISFPD